MDALETQDAVLGEILKHDGLTLGQISTNLQLPRKNISNALQRLKKQGSIINVLDDKDPSIHYWVEDPQPAAIEAEDLTDNLETIDLKPIQITLDPNNPIEASLFLIHEAIKGTFISLPIDSLEKAKILDALHEARQLTGFGSKGVWIDKAAKLIDLLPEVSA
jgi:hypothetical protein